MTPVNTTKPTNDDDEINLSDLFNTLLQNIRTIIAVFVVVLILGLAYAVTAPPVYQTDALIQVEDQGGGLGLAGLTQFSEALGVQQSSIAGEIEILRSREVLLKAIEKTRATERIQVDNHFPLIGEWLARRNEAGQTGLAEPFLGLSGFAWGGERLELAELNVPSGTYFLELTGDGYVFKDEDENVLVESDQVGQRVSFTVSGREASFAVQSFLGREGTRFRVQKLSPISVFGQLRQSLNVAEAGAQSRVIRLTLESQDRQFAADLINAVASAYLQQNVERRSAEASSRLAFLEGQLPKLRESLEQKEEELSDFRSFSGTISIPEETQGLLGQAVELENKRLELQLKQDEMRQRYRSEHPTLKVINNQLTAIQDATDELGRAIDKLPQAQRDLLRLERDTQVNTQLYISLLNNAQELRVAEAGTIGTVRIIDFAVLAERPIKPKRSLIVAVSALLGLMLGVMGTLLRSFLRPAVQRAEQIEQQTGLSTYVSVPESTKQKSFRIAQIGRRKRIDTQQLLAFDSPEDPAVESLRSLRTGLQFAMMGTEGKTLAITGATSSVGKSFVSANLSAVLASADNRVVLIDTDLRRRRLHEYFGYERKRHGLSDVLLGHKTLADVLVKVNDHFSVLPAGTPSPNPGDLMLSSQLAQALDQLKNEFDLVVADTAPLLPVADTLALMRHMDISLMVARAEHTTIAEVRDALSKLRTAGVDGPVKGVVFNGVRRYRLGYGSSYRYYYSYK